MDGLLIFRVSKVWACKRKLAILPGLLVIGLAGCAIRAMYFFACPRILSEVTALDQAKPWIVTAGGFSIFINMYCTILLRWGRFGGIHHDPRFDKPSSNEVSEVFAQTASATYFWYTFLFSFWLAGVEMRFMVDMTPVVLGIFHMFGYLLIEVKRTEACHAWIKAQDIWTGEDDYKDVKSTFFADITSAV
ncbi:hypothetical protein C8R43DRAFT_162904 [Mycena crocata]|nr:hypothetical protein C8R43DRAFT_162904 [Mycena crocata]